MKKFFTHIITASLCICLTLGSSVCAQAAAWPALAGIQTYGISANNDTICYETAYSSETYGVIYASDLIRITGYSNGRFRCRYPTKNGTKTAWVNSSAITGGSVNHTISSFIAANNLPVYRRLNGSAQIGSIFRNDTVFVIAQSNGRSQVIYPIDTNAYKMGWIDSACVPFDASAEKVADIPEGKYIIETKLDSSKVLDIHGISMEDGGNLEICRKNGQSNQIIEVKKAGDQYMLIASHSGKAIEIFGCSSASGSNVNQWEVNRSLGQFWSFADAGSGYVYIKSLLGTYLDVRDGYAADGQNVWAYSGNQTDAQKWKLIPIETEQPSQAPADTTISSVLYQTDNRSYLTCGFDGYTSTDGRHEGIDFAKGYGSVVHALTDGIVTRITKGKDGTDNGCLSTIAIYFPSADKTIVYLHAAPLDSLYVNQNVSKGQAIATEARRGASSSHVHVEVRSGKKTAAAKSLHDYTLENSNPVPFWNSLGYTVK